MKLAGKQTNVPIEGTLCWITICKIFAAFIIDFNRSVVARHQWKVL